MGAAPPAERGRRVGLAPVAELSFQSRAHEHELCRCGLRQLTQGALERLVFGVGHVSLYLPVRRPRQPARPFRRRSTCAA
jgi:hypothetical protein